jgi:subfamily B ATP-binding cassette protein HlyB/CyaB
MTDNIQAIEAFLAQTAPFDRVGAEAIAEIATQVQVRSRSVGQEIVVGTELPTHITIAYQGKIRLLGYDPNTKMPIALKLLEPGAILGWISLLRGVPCETAIASTEVVGLAIAADNFRAILHKYRSIAQYFEQQVPLSEVFEFVAKFAEKQPQDVPNLSELARKAQREAIAKTFPIGRIPRSQLDPACVWFVSCGADHSDFNRSCFGGGALANSGDYSLGRRDCDLV